MNLTRRTFLSRSSLGFAMAGALAAVPGLATLMKAPNNASPAAPAHTAGYEPLVAHVRDLTKGEISLMAGTNHVIVRDVDLATRLYKAAAVSR